VIDKSIFGREMTLLADRFNRDISKPVIARYFEFLNAHLATDEFVAAARVVFDHDQFWPAPVRFLEAAGVDPKSEADAAWELSLSEARRGIARPLSEYDPGHAAALSAVGKNHRIGQTREDQLPFLKRDFVNAFVAHRERKNHPELEKPPVPELLA
jgi:hypothetical protein